MVTESGTRQIADSNVDQPESTSVLTVTETTAVVWRYCCQASLLGVTGTAGECVFPTKLTQCGFCSAHYTYLPLFFV